jgi:cytochrome c oxidase subunit II
MSNLYAKFKRKGILAIASIFLAACGHGNQSAIESAGVQAGRLNGLWWLFFWITAAVYVAVMLLLIVAYFRVPRAGDGSEAEILPDKGRERRVSNIVKSGVALTVLTVFALMIVSFRAGQAIDLLSQAPDPLEIKVTGQQWWWQVEYQDRTPSNIVTSANEIHIPVGRPIKIDLVSNDVIHSFWVPNLHGKRDLVPNYPTTIYFQADKPGVYWGQCAEYCGYQHAKMRLMVIAESPEDFSAWYAASQQPAKEPTTDSQKLGQQIFLRSVCAQCHTINGTDASGRVGPNLTHVASKPYIASASLQNSQENLMNWISDPQSIKPGIRMPMNTYSESDLNALVDYIQNLK